jgi:AP-3 complex subunit beta
MVYMYLVHYADATVSPLNNQNPPQPAVNARCCPPLQVSCRELALLSINSFQKDLAAANQLIRALALRVMTSIRVR